jgi:hypothetical protein
MKQSLRQLILLSAVTVILAGCADQAQQPSEPSKAAPKAPGVTLVAPSVASALGYSIPSCPPTQADAQKAIDTLLPQLFAPGAGRRGKAQGLSNDMEKARYANNVNLADAKADSLLNFALQQYYTGQLLDQSTDLATTQQRLVSFITYVYCFNGYFPLPDRALFDQLLSANNSVLIRNGTPTTVVNDNTGNAGVKVVQGDVPTTVFGTYVSVVRTGVPLPTSLDWYGLDGYKLGAFEFRADPAVTFTEPVLTGVCINYDNTVVTSPSDLRLAHAVPFGSTPAAGNNVVTTADGTIEIGAPASTAPLGLACTPLPVLAASAFGRAVERFAGLFLPQDLLAGTTGGGVGSTVKTFSPFAAVDIRLATTSTGPSSPLYIPLNSTTTTAATTVTAKTRNSQVGIGGIPVAFATGTAGSSFSPASPSTDANGTASSTWTLVAGTNTGSGTPALAPLVFTPAAASFSVNVTQETALSFDGPLTLPNGVQGTAYQSTTFTASGGIGTYAWTSTGSLPTGLTLSSAGVLSGTTTAAGSFSFSVTVTSGAQTQSKSYSVTVALPPVSITTASPLPSATVGASYSQTLQSSGGAGAGSYSYVLTNGALPAGLNFSAAGLISGIATAVGSSSFTVQVTSGTGPTAVTSSKAFSLSAINPTAINLSFDPGPSKSVCYAIGVAMTPGIRVRVTDQSGNLLSGITVGMVGVTNNGSKVDVSPPSVVSSGGYASFGGPTINKTGGYALIASTTAPFSATITSAKFTISPSCP